MSVLILKSEMAIGNVTVHREAANRFLVTQPYGRFGSTVWVRETRDKAFGMAAEFIAGKTYGHDLPTRADADAADTALLEKALLAGWDIV